MPAPTFDKDARAVELGLHFEVPLTTDLREALEQRGTREEIESKSGTRTSYQLGPVLRDQRLIFGFAAHAPEDNEVYLHLRMVNKPRAEPPENIVERSLKVGGAAGLHAIFADAIAKAPMPPIASFILKFRIDAKAWRGPVPRPPHPEIDAAIAPLGQGVVEQVGYRFTQSVSGLDEVTVIYFHQGRPFYRVGVQARSPVRLVEETFRWPVVSDACDLVLGHLFSERGDPDVETG